MDRAKLRELLDAADERLDRETFKQHLSFDLDAPDDAEIVITAGTQRALNALLAELDRQLKEDDK